MIENAARRKWARRVAAVAIAVAVIVATYAWLSPGPVGHWAFDGVDRDRVALRIYDDGAAHFQPDKRGPSLPCNWKRVGYNRADILCDRFALELAVQGDQATLKDNRPPATLDPWDSDLFVMVRVR